MIRSIRLAVLASPLAVGAVSAREMSAQATCTRTAESSPTTRTWPPPLDRVISLHERGVSLRDALDRLAAAARMRLAYSAELLPLDRRVCVNRTAVTAGAALSELLEGVPVQPVVTDADRVVLTPAPASAVDAADAPQALSRRSGALERVVASRSRTRCSSLRSMSSRSIMSR